MSEAEAEEKFKKAVLDAYPNDSTIKKLLSKDSYWTLLGHYLKISSLIVPDVVIEAILNDKIDELLILAEICQQKAEVYRLWQAENKRLKTLPPEESY